MESFSFYTLSVALLILCLFYQSSHCQQTYVSYKDDPINCSENPSIAKRYLCNDPLKSCKSFVTFRSRPRYDTAINIAYLLGSEASNIASINNISSIEDKIPSNKLIIVPIFCSCSGSIYQHYAPYTVKPPDSFFKIANDTYQGLTTCQALIGENHYDSENIPAGTELVVPVRCACPGENQTANGVASLLVYMVTWGDTISSIAEAFMANVERTFEANELSENNSIIYPFTPILVPLESKTFTTNPARRFSYNMFTRNEL